MIAPTTNATSLANLAPRPDRIGRLGGGRDFARSPSRQLTCPTTCSRSSTSASSTSAAPIGDPSAGEPIQYDHLRIEHDEGTVEIVVYDRAILLFGTESEAVRRIHQVCCRLEDLGARRSLA